MACQRLQVLENVAAAITGARHGTVRGVSSRLYVHVGLKTLLIGVEESVNVIRGDQTHGYHHTVHSGLSILDLGLLEGRNRRLRRMRDDRIANAREPRVD